MLITYKELPWGKKGQDSLAARYCASTPGTDFKIEDSREYAEMWMGTYPTTPSYVLSTKEKLQDVLNANKEKPIGKTVLRKFGANLPFLPKVLLPLTGILLDFHLLTAHCPRFSLWPKPFLSRIPRQRPCC
jgi:mannose-6-phosphate isomerase